MPSGEGEAAGDQAARWPPGMRWASKDRVERLAETGQFRVDDSRGVRGDFGGIGRPTWIRTMTKGFKDPCAAITPSANSADSLGGGLLA